MGRPSPDPVELPLEAEAYLTRLVVEDGRSPATIEAYRRELRRYVGFLGHHDLSAVSTDDLRRFLGSLQRAGLGPSVVARAASVARGLHRHLATEREGRTDPGATLAVPPRPRGLPKALDLEQVSALLGSVGGDRPVDRRDRAMLEVLYGTGVRISELVGLDLRSLDREARLLLVMGKGSKERLVPVGRFALDALDAWCEVRSAWSRRGDRSAASAMFLNQRGGRLTRQGAWLVLRRRAELVGLGDLVHPHVLRHSCATHMLDHGADLRTVQEMLGHASLSTTQIYTKVATARLWEVYDAAHPRALAEVGV